MRTLLATFALMLMLAPRLARAQETADPDPNMPRPIAARDSVWMEELTWLEVRDAIKAGKTTAIVATGGVEQNGPYVATGKHNYVLQATCEAIAQRLGNALVAPIVKFVPEGDIDPPTDHMKYPGTFSVSKETYEALLTEIAGSLRQHGFKHIIFIADSGGNVDGMQAVANKLAAEWRGMPTVHYIREYYEQDIWSYDYLKSLGIVQQPDVKSSQRGALHDDYHYESIIATVDPRHIRVDERRKAGLTSIYGISVLPVHKTVANGKMLVEYRVGITVVAIKKALEQP
jgi:creatinine amidohydrolase/Fe(II)-dependent formamide hydrolase-like protein